MAIIAEYQIGNGMAYICDDYFVKTKGEADEILENISGIYVQSQLNKRRKEFEATRQEGVDFEDKS